MNRFTRRFTCAASLSVSAIFLAYIILSITLKNADVCGTRNVLVDCRLSQEGATTRNESARTTWSRLDYIQYVSIRGLVPKISTDEHLQKYFLPMRTQRYRTIQQAIILHVE